MERNGEGDREREKEREREREKKRERGKIEYSRRNKESSKLIEVHCIEFEGLYLNIE